MLQIGDEKTMTVREVAEALDLSYDTIAKHARNMGLSENGKTTYLTESQATEIKKRIGKHDLLLSSKVESITTALEIEEMTAKVLAYHIGEVERLRAEAASNAPKVESFYALMRSERTMSISQAAKHFGAHPKTQVFPYLRACGYLTQKDLPTQAALDAGYLATRKTRCPDGELRDQAVVLDCQLDMWRTRVIPQIARWEKED